MIKSQEGFGLFSFDSSYMKFALPAITNGIMSVVVPTIPDRLPFAMRPVLIIIVVRRPDMSDIISVPLA